MIPVFTMEGPSEPRLQPEDCKLMKTLAPTAIKLSAPGGVAVTWSDGHVSVYPYDYLRKKCPCSTCRDTPPRIVTENDAFRLVGQQPIKPSGAEPVGRYAVLIRWNDGHYSGIYAYDYLREICPCPDCAGS